ncbi:MAG TPA: hypothetical protein VIA18_21090 [Polyangia bacterium]|jgi:hypothetical protein|nr:hypothetical protein [Polyangia bacterium]
MSLDAAQRAFEAGDFAESRRLAQAIVDGSGDEADKRAAAELIKRTDIDPVVVYMSLGCVTLFVAIVVSTLLR